MRASELRFVLQGQTGRLETREETWSWFKANYDRIAAKVPEEFAGYLPWNAASLCSESAAKDAEAFFAPRIEKLAGGPRNLAGAVEALRLCAAQVEAHRESATAFFAR